MRYFILAIVLLVSCANPGGKANEDVKQPVLVSDSVRALHNAVKAFEESVASSKDSLLRYGISAVNDTCIDFLYTVYGGERLKGDSLTVDQCSIKLTSLNDRDSAYALGYTLFIQDSIPVMPDLAVGAMIHTFEYNKIQRKLSKAYLGQHDSYMLGSDLEKMYLRSSNDRQRTK